MDEVYLKYYVNQAGSGVGHFYSGPIYQRGYGVGSFLGGLFRSVLPLLKKGGIALGKELISCGTNVMQDIDQNIPASVAVKNHGKQSLSNMKKKFLNMSGTGYKAIKKLKAVQSRKRTQRKQSTKKKKSPTKKHPKKNTKTNKTTKSKKKQKLSDIFDF